MRRWRTLVKLEAVQAVLKVAGEDLLLKVAVLGGEEVQARAAVLVLTARVVPVALVRKAVGGVQAHPVPVALVLTTVLVQVAGEVLVVKQLLPQPKKLEALQQQLAKNQLLQVSIKWQ